MSPNFARKFTIAVIACALALTACGSSSEPARSASSNYSQATRVAPCGVSISSLGASKQLVVHYQPSQATGWPAPYSLTVGGHQSCVQVFYDHDTYRISLLPFGPAGGSPNPVYEAVPKDPNVAFKNTLAQDFGRIYTYRYLGGLPSGAEFVVESYGVRLYREVKGLVWGSDLYAIYEPGKTGPAINSDLQFIQVYSTRYPAGGGAGSRVDAPGPTPYYWPGASTTAHRRRTEPHRDLPRIRPTAPTRKCLFPSSSTRNDERPEGIIGPAPNITGIANAAASAHRA